MLTQKEKDILKNLSSNEKQYLKKACREVFHNNASALPKLRGRYLSALGLGYWFPMIYSLTGEDNTYTESCGKDYNNDLIEACSNLYQ